MSRPMPPRATILALLVSLSMTFSGCGSSDEPKLADVKQLQPPASPKFEAKAPPKAPPAGGMGGSPPIDLNKGYRGPPK